MSEYQYYEFVALDGPVSDEGMQYARGCSTRAEVSRYRWRNEYNWGNFHGDPIKLLQYYDAHVYLTNWATFVFAIGVPSDGIDTGKIGPYLWDMQWASGLRLTRNANRTVISWERVDEGGWCDCWDEESPLDALAGIREEILRGDMRALFIGWLAGLDSDEPPEAIPPIVPGMADLTTPQQELVERLQVDRDCLAAAAALSPDMQSMTECADELIHELPPEEARHYLRRVAHGEGTQVMNELKRRAAVGCESTAARCGVETFFSKLSDLRETRLRRESEEREARQRAEEAARKRHLTAVMEHADRTWSELDSLMKTKKSAAYDDIAAILKELAAAYVHEARESEFRTKISTFQSKWSNRPAMMRRIEAL